MANGESSDSIPDNSTAFLKQILSKLKDPAALYSLALFVLALPLGTAMGDYPLAYWMALAFSLPVLGVRVYQISVQGRNDARKLEFDNQTKLAKISSDHQIKLARLHLKAQPTATSTIPQISLPTTPATLRAPQTAPPLLPPPPHSPQPRPPRKGRRSADRGNKGS